MFRKILNSRLCRAVCWYVILTMAVPAYVFNAPVRAAAQEGSGEVTDTGSLMTKIAVIGLDNQTDSDFLGDDHGIGQIITEAHKLQIDEKEKIEFMPKDDVLNYIESGDNITESLSISIGQDMEAEQVIFGSVSDVDVPSTEQASVRVEVSVFDVQKNVLVSKSASYGSVYQRGFSGTREELVSLALKDGLKKTLDEAFGNMYKYGVVTLVKGSVIHSNLSSRDGLSKGALIAVLREGAQIATIEVDETTVAYSRAKVVEVFERTSIRSGDRARLIYTPSPYSKASVAPDMKKKSKRGNPLMMAVVGAAIVLSLSGSNKGSAEPPQPRSGSQVVNSSDYRAAVYSSTGWDQNYIPAAPVKITDANSTSLAACSPTANCSTGVCVVPQAMYDFTWQSSPRFPTIPTPPGGYEIGFDLTGATDLNGTLLSTTDYSKMKIATCNTQTSQWDFVTPTTVENLSWLGNKKAAHGKVTHFTPYAVVIDNRPTPLPAPGNFTVGCEDSKVLLSWDKIQDAANAGYLVYNCSSTSCSAVRETITDVNDTSTDYNVSNDQEYCFAVSGKSSTPTQSATLSAIKCKTPSATTCGTEGIALLSPSNGATLNAVKPTFEYVGSGTSKKYILNIKDSTGMIVYTNSQDGELAGASTSTTSMPKEYYSITGFAPNDGVYSWIVTGYLANGQAIYSQQYTFTATNMGGNTINCSNPPPLVAPTLITPENGVQITTEKPMFYWSSASNAADYLLTVTDDQSQVVMETLTGNAKSTEYDGTPLYNGKTYSWHVRSTNECSVSTPSTDRFFTKMSGTGTIQIPTPQWVTMAEDGKSPIIGGDKYVILNWRQVTSNILGGYKIYRSTDNVSYNEIEQIALGQIDTPNANSNCPTFSVTNPGFCDTSVTNGETYYYKVAGYDTGYTAGDKSTYQSTTLPLQRPVLVAPGSVSGETLGAATPTFTWLPVDGVGVTYMLTLREKSTQELVWLKSGIGSTFIDFDPSIPLKENTEYQWTIRAQNEKSVISEYSQVFKFTKGQVFKKPDTPTWCKGTSAGSCAGNPGGPPYEYNSSGAFDTITIYWKKVTTSNNIAGYYIYRSNDSTTVYTSRLTNVTNVACEGNSAMVCFTQTQVPRGKFYYYAVSAFDTTGLESDPSTLLQIRYDLRAPVVIYPSQDQIVYDAEPEFSWLKVTGATKYRIQVDKDGSFSSTNLIWNALVNAENTDVEKIKYGDVSAPSAPLRNPTSSSSIGETYFWRVCTLNEVTTSESACTPANKFYKNLKPPEMKNPNNDLVMYPVHFNWLASPGAYQYQFRICEGYQCCDSTSCTAPVIYQDVIVQQANETVFGKIISANDVAMQNCDTPENTTTCTTGIYSWQVRALDENGATSGEWRDHISRSFIKVGAAPPTLVLPADETVVQPDSQEGQTAMCTDLYGNLTYKYNIHFAWMSASSASGYKFKIIDVPASQNAGHEVVYMQASVGNVTSIDITECGDIGGVSGAGIPLAAGQLYKWNVTAEGVPFSASNERSFYTGLPAPKLLAPDDGKQVILWSNCDNDSSMLCVHFEWNGGSFTTGSGDVTLPGVIGAGSYDIEILDQQRNVYYCERKATKGTVCDPSNANCFKNTYVTSCDLSTADAFNNDRFTWRVRARDASSVTADDGGLGMPGPWSQSRNFTILIPGPVLASPPDSGPTCYDDHSLDAVENTGGCTPVGCQNPQFWWSPIPLSAEACYRIEVSDTSDFRNLLYAKDSVNNAADFVCAAGTGCNSFKTPITTLIPMTNGVKYYWRIGASVPPEASAPCGTTWIYSETWDFLKRPNNGFSLSYSNLTYQSVTLSWVKPVNCQGDSSDALSVPDVPPTGGGFIIYTESNLSTTRASASIYSMLPPTQNTLDITTLAADTDYSFCVSSLDASGYFTDGGHVSFWECVSFTTPSAPTTP